MSSHISNKFEKVEWPQKLPFWVRVVLRRKFDKTKGVISEVNTTNTNCNLRGALSPRIAHNSLAPVNFSNQHIPIRRKQLERKRRDQKEENKNIKKIVEQHLIKFIITLFNWIYYVTEIKVF